jgi:hypothetical protein
MGGFSSGGGVVFTTQMSLSATTATAGKCRLTVTRSKYRKRTLIPLYDS